MAKIIAVTNTDKYSPDYLVEMSKSEITHLMGENYASSIQNENAFRIGAVIPIVEAWGRLDNLAKIQPTLDGVALKMRSVADWLDTVPAVLAPPSPKKSAKEKTE